MAKKRGSSNGGRGRGGARKGGSGQYYYVQGERVGVEQRKDLVAVCFHARAAEAEITSFAEGRSGLTPATEFPDMQKSNVRLFKVAEGERSAAEEMLEQARADASVETVGEVFVSDDGRPLVLTDQLVVKFKPDVTEAEIEAIKAKKGLRTSESLSWVENGFILSVRKNGEPLYDALQAANQLVEQGDAEYAYPNWIEYVGYRTTVVADDVAAPPEDEIRHGIHPTDPLFAQQWHHENTGQSGGTPGADIRTPLAWQTTMGSPAIRIAVIDGGTDIAHNDLNTPGKIVAPIDLQVNPPDANPLGGSHGTEVAGMAVAAANNGCAGAGSAPNCRLIAIRAGDTMAQVLMARGFIYAADHGADIITCSLGPFNTAWPLTDALREAIDYATTYGRNGRGCVYTQAVDNANAAINIDQVASYERSIAVSRSNDRDRFDNAATGVELDLIAPGRNVVTITNTTATNACTTRTVTGTSYATPLTAGVAGLVLSVNPNLSWEEVRQVLMDSADKIDAATQAYAPAPAGRPPGTRNNNCGYGRVNANTAVNLARAGSRRDLFIRDTTSDTGTVPQPQWGFWNSPDIWVRNNDDGGTSHQDTIRGRDNFLHARVRNRGSLASLPCWVRFYVTSFAGTEFRYPLDFKRDTTANPGGGTAGNLRPAAQFPALGTYLLGEQRIGSIAAGGNAVAKIRWRQQLIPPAANWHPCLLAEISPHDGPMPTGVNVWDNNNLGQKNITIVNARRGELLSVPFRFSALNAVQATALSLDVVKESLDFPLFLELKSPELLDLVASSAQIARPPVLAPVRPPLFPGIITDPRLPLKISFLEPTRIAVLGGERAGDKALVLSFPRGAALEIDTIAQLGETEEERDVPPAVLAPPGLLPGPVLAGGRPGWGIEKLDGIDVIALRPELKVASVKVPANQIATKEASLKIRVPRQAVVGERYGFDVAQRDASGRVVGGIRVEVNVVA